MANHFQFGQEPDLDAMKQNIADRAFSIKLKGGLISLALVGVALAALVVAPQAFGALAPLIGMAGLFGGAIASLLTLKETKKLQIDEEFLQSRMQGRNYWGGYREELGPTGLSAPMVGGPIQGKTQSRE